MDVSNSLLVAMMFVMVLSIGIGNLLMALSGLIDHRTESQHHWIPTSWLLLLLLQHLNLFWHTLEILENEQWLFGTFLYIVTGPILLFLALGLMLPAPDAGKETSPVDQYVRVARKFFSIMSIFMLWNIGVDFVLGLGAAGFSVSNLGFLLLFLLLAWSKEERIHGAATVVTGALMLLVLSMQAVTSMG